VTASKRVGRLSKFCNSGRIIRKLRENFQNFVAVRQRLARFEVVGVLDSADLSSGEEDKTWCIIFDGHMCAAARFDHKAREDVQNFRKKRNLEATFNLGAAGVDSPSYICFLKLNSSRKSTLSRKSPTWQSTPRQTSRCSCPNQTSTGLRSLSDATARMNGRCSTMKSPPEAIASYRTSFHDQLPVTCNS
jgi:hypothetical protein